MSRVSLQALQGLPAPSRGHPLGYGLLFPLRLWEPSLQAKAGQGRSGERTGPQRPLLTPRPSHSWAPPAPCWIHKQTLKTKKPGFAWRQKQQLPWFSEPPCPRRHGQNPPHVTTAARGFRGSPAPTAQAVVATPQPCSSAPTAPSKDLGSPCQHQNINEETDAERTLSRREIPS